MCPGSGPARTRPPASQGGRGRCPHRPRSREVQEGEPSEMVSRAAPTTLPTVDPPPRVCSTDPQRAGWVLGHTPRMHAPTRSLGVAGLRPPPPAPACTTSAWAALLPASWLRGGRPVPLRLSGCTLGVCLSGARSTQPRGDSRRGHHHQHRARFPRHGPFRAQWPGSGWPRPLPMPGTCRKRPSGPSMLFPPDNRGQRLTRKTGNL